MRRRGRRAIVPIGITGGGITGARQLFGLTDDSFHHARDLCQFGIQSLVNDIFDLRRVGVQPLAELTAEICNGLIPPMRRGRVPYRRTTVFRGAADATIRGSEDGSGGARRCIFHGTLCSVEERLLLPVENVSGPNLVCTKGPDHPETGVVESGS